jgi:uncharacterized OsmC-like protein
LPISRPTATPTVVIPLVFPAVGAVNVLSRIRVRIDACGISAINDRGDEIRYAVSPSASGFNPIELLSASLGICTAINLRKELGAASGGAPASPSDVAVECVKAPDLPSRVEKLEVVVGLLEGITGAMADGVVHRAEAACTIANTLLAAAGAS